ncbi:MAG: hypothetical protein JXK04_06680 [Campylobacterales bacterium]|nr:hypothetical protein [Campylobacterales bacterium]
MSFLRTLIMVFVLSIMAYAEPVIFHNRSEQPNRFEHSRENGEGVKIAVLSSSKVIGKYSQSVYNVSLATLMSCKHEGYELKHYVIPDESAGAISAALNTIAQEGMDAILAPLTSGGVKNLLEQRPALPVFVPTVHKRDFPYAPDNVVFGAIDYERQIEALLPYMSESIAIFYDSSAVGNQLKASTEEVFLSHKRDKKTISSYPVDPKGEKIVAHLSRPASFSKKSIILHIPVVKSALLTAHMTFTGVKERNILSTQINVDPSLLTLTQYNDRKNMILANSLVEFPADIYETNILMNNDIVFDWVHYAASVGIDYLVSALTSTPRHYTMRISNAQVLYSIELLRAKEFGFEPLNP